MFLKKIYGFIKYVFDSEEKNFRKDLKKIIGFYPINLTYYKTAFIHKSASYINHLGQIVNNERLEFLGDAILGAVVGDFLFEHFPSGDEGFLTKTRSKLVNRATLTELAHKIGLDNFIITHIKKYTVYKHIPGNALEAFIGAIYLDYGYYATAQFIIKQLIYKHIDLHKVIISDNNFKSQILEWAQHEHIPIKFQTEQIPNTSPAQFTSNLYVNDQIMGSGQGYSKKEAEQNAAKQAIDNLNIPHHNPFLNHNNRKN